MSQYTEEQIEEFKKKADRWDELDAKIGAMYEHEGEDTSLLDVGEEAADAFGYL